MVDDGRGGRPALAHRPAGFPAATAFVHQPLDPLMESSAGLGAGLDWKTSLQELTASGSLGVPDYRVAEQGPDHQKCFQAEVRVGSELMGSGSGSSKKEAEQMAAEVAWTELSRRGTAVLSSPVEPVTADFIASEQAAVSEHHGDSEQDA